MNAEASPTRTPTPTPMESARASERGARHWWLQRLSALALIPLTLWFVFAILGHIGDRHQAALAWVGQPGVAVALSAYIVLMFFHAQLGLQVVVEDYVSSEGARMKTLLALKAVNLLGGAAAIVSVLSVAL